MTNPEYVMPIHGEHRHQMSYMRIAKELGYDDKHILCCDNGAVIELSQDGVEVLSYIKLCEILVDGYGIGDIGRAVLRERLNLAESGICFITGIVNMKRREFVQGPFFSTKGLVYEKESEEIMNDAVNTASDIFFNNSIQTLDDLNNGIKSEIRSFFSKRTQRKPIVISMIMEDLEEHDKHSKKRYKRHK